MIIWVSQVAWWGYSWVFLSSLTSYRVFQEVSLSATGSLYKTEGKKRTEDFCWARNCRELADKSNTFQFTELTQKIPFTGKHVKKERVCFFSLHNLFFNSYVVLVVRCPGFWLSMNLWRFSPFVVALLENILSTRLQGSMKWSHSSEGESWCNKARERINNRDPVSALIWEGFFWEWKLFDSFLCGYTSVL